MATKNGIEDLFICGRCHMNYTDLTLFLQHRSTCLGRQTSSSNLFDAIIKENSSNSELLHENPSNEFDLLFSSPVDQIVINHETMSNSEITSTTMSSSSSVILAECPVCDQRCDGDITLENHIFEHSFCLDDEPSTSLLECKQCTITFTSNANLTLHKKLIHRLTPVFRCFNSTCSQLFDKPVDFILHTRHHQEKRSNTRRRKQIFRCRLCKILCHSSEQLEEHLSKNEHQFSCQLCSAMFNSNNAYHNHLAQHNETIPIYRCHLCEKTFQKRLDLSKHITTSHHDDLPKQKSCPTCQLTFKTTFHLNRHNVTKHSTEKPFKCEQEGCQQAFARKDKLKQHAAKHSAAGGMFQCRICVKTFVRPEHLRDHDIVRHSHEFPFRCEYCRKGFLHQSQLYTHHKQHHPTEHQTDSLTIE